LFLKNEEATRNNILAAFESHLLTNARIPDHGDASMILFFAGHGTRVDAPGNLMSQDGKVEGICPVDERTNSGGKYVHTIPDYVLVHLLRELCEKKGHNTVRMPLVFLKAANLNFYTDRHIRFMPLRRHGTGCRPGSSCKFTFVRGASGP
jgi:hypothetical protein